MARPYNMTAIRRVINALMRPLLRLGLVPGTTYLLTTRGRKTGQLHSTPVTLLEEDGQRWLVAPYGSVGWVHNIRVSGRAILRKGRQTDKIEVVEAGSQESAPILKKYVQMAPIVLPFFDVGLRSSLEEFEAEAPCHPVFRITRSIRE